MTVIPIASARARGDAERPALRWLAWGLVAAVLLGLFLFGGIQPHVRPVLAGVVGLLAGLVLILAPPSERPGWAWCAAAAGLPLWLALQLVPLPLSLQPAARADLVTRLWPGPAAGCAGAAVLPAAPGWVASTIDAVATREFLFVVLAALLVLLAARTYFATRPAAREALIGAVALFTACEAIYAIAQWTSGTPKVLWFTKINYLDAATGTLINRNHFAMLLYIGIGCALTLLLARRRAGSADHGRSAAIDTSLAVIVGLQLAGVAASKSRAGAAATLLVLLSVLPALLRPRRGRPALAIAAVVGLLAVPTLVVVAPAMRERLENLPKEWESPAGRRAVVAHSLGIVADFPLLGTGGKTFEYAFQLYRPPEIQARYDYAHNDYVQLLTEAGPVGLALALLPVGLFAWELRRRRSAPAEADRGTALPLFVAFAAVALHEFVDFGLQMPANAFLLALLAGAALAREPEPSRRGRGAVVLGAVGIALALPAALHGAARWGFLSGVVTRPDLPDVRHGNASELWRQWRADQSKSAVLCRAIAEEARAQELRPFAAIYAERFALQLAAAAELGRVEPGRAEAFREQAARAADRARGLDPWQGDTRSRLINVSLALGDLDQAVEDALVIARTSPTNVRGAVRTLLGAGVPALLLGEALEREPRALQELIAALLQENDLETARAILPADSVPTPELCRIAPSIASVLTRAHKLPAEPFLAACLDVPEIRSEPALLDNVRSTLARELMNTGHPERADGLVREIGQQAMRAWIEIDLALKLGDFDRAARAGWLLIDGEPPLDDLREARVRMKLGEAYARQGKLPMSAEQYELALRLDPSQSAACERALNALRRGKSPF
ncbi:MAG: O-antigen ligase family protein [Acidobacteria bacterium]|nr:O-antigen ligase family protein [Acidobacteriota bacterium]